MFATKISFSSSGAGRVTFMAAAQILNDTSGLTTGLKISALMLISAFLSLLKPSAPYRPALQENTHRLTLSMSPDEVYMEKQAEEEEEKLQKKIQALSDTDRQEIYEKGNNNFTVWKLDPTKLEKLSVLNAFLSVEPHGI